MMNPKLLKSFRTLVSLVFVLLPGLCECQDLTFSFAAFPPDQGMISIVGMAQDSKGYIWLADNNAGLSKYDGVRLTSYKPDINKENSIGAGRLECILVDNQDYIWTGSFAQGLDRFDPETETFTHFQHNKNDPSSICSDSLRTILQSRDNSLWFGTAKGLDNYDIETGKFTHFTGTSEDALLLSKEHVRTLYEDREGILWIGCGSIFTGDIQDPLMGGLYKLDRATGEVTRYRHNKNDPNSLIDNRVRAIFEDSRGVFWVGTAGDGLHTMDREKGIFERHLYDPKHPEKLSRPALIHKYNYAEDHITFITEDAKGYVWIGTFSGGLNRYNPKTAITKHFGTDEEGAFKTEYNDFWASMMTKDNLLWISVWQPADNNRLLYKISAETNFVYFSSLDKTAIVFAQTSDSVLWIGTNQGLLRKNKDESYDTFYINQKKEAIENSINYLEKDDHNNLWVSTSNGLYYFNTKTESFATYKYTVKTEKKLSSDTVILSQLNRDGTIWLGTPKGLNLFNIEIDEVNTYKHDPEDTATISNDIVISIMPDEKGNAWIGTQRGLNFYNKTSDKFIRSKKFNSTYFSLYKDSKKRIWMGMITAGLHVLDQKTNQFVPLIDPAGKLNNQSIWGITEDKDHFLWLNTLVGFVKLNTESGDAVVFAKSWNIDAINCTNIAFTTLQGEIVIGHRDGYYHFFPPDFEKAKTTPRPFFSKFFLDNKQLIPGVDAPLPKALSQTEKITLAYDNNNFAVEINNIDYLSGTSEKNFMYKLENYEDVWRIYTGENKAYYYNVPSGNYTFRLKASNLYGKWGEKSLSVVILSPWYNTPWAYLLYGIMFIGGIVLTDRIQRKRLLEKEKNKAKEKELLQAKEIEKAYRELKATQTQLIQSEKMASLGELTAGIAHEIQNPLNFVNNFSELNKELIEELLAESSKVIAERDKKLETELLNDIKINEEKIHHHGQRASGIVKGMLEHSRTGDGKKEPTDINALADEYLRLAYHGLRAKDKSFNAEFKTDFDEKLPKIQVIPQDKGRVLLNLINNAFYAVDKKAKSGIEGYKPEVIVSTKFSPSGGGQGEDQIEISVKDNGDGIPENIKEKIFQPFFTTKPTGQGTGLGLSLSYDIVKSHNGEISLKSEPGIGTEFIINLPINLK